MNKNIIIITAVAAFILFAFMVAVGINNNRSNEINESTGSTHQIIRESKIHQTLI